MTEPKETQSAESSIVKAAFGAKNRARLIDAYFAGHPAPDAATAWQHVYRLLLWADQTTGLAHCYESDKCQPGKNWYARSLAFHDWAASSLGTSPTGLAEEIDWLFRRATTDLATEVLSRATTLTAAAARQRQPYEGRGFPRPGEDPELVAIVKEVLGEHVIGEPTSEKWQLLVQRIRQYLALENKRRNLVGEGFEDVLAATMKRAPGGAALDIRSRKLLHELPGFNRARKDDKPNKVDLAIIRPSMRTLVTAKWSLRADREKQFQSEFSEYVQAESDRQRFEYVFATNEFDPARLMRACESLVGNNVMFTHVVHMNTDALKATYAVADIADGKEKRKNVQTQRKVIGYIDAGRLISLGKWLELLGS